MDQSFLVGAAMEHGPGLLLGAAVEHGSGFLLGAAMELGGLSVGAFRSMGQRLLKGAAIHRNEGTRF